MDLFHERWYAPICKKLTNHKYNKLVLWSEDFVKRGFKYPNRSEFYYKCKICGYLFWNNHISKDDLEKIKKLHNKE